MLFVNGVKHRVALCSDASSPAFGVTGGNWEDANFKVNWDGSLYASEANITGIINAKKGGSIAGWQLSENAIYSTKVGMSNNMSNYAFWAGHEKGWSSSVQAPFRVGHDGSLVATNATITGTINATNGKIGNWQINNGSLYASGISSSYTGAAIWLEIGGLTYSDSGMVTPLAASWRNVLLSVTGSDVRIKNNINDIENKYEEFFNLLQPKTFNYTPEAKCGNTEILHFGFVAQDILTAQAVTETNDLALVFKEDYYSLRMQEFIALNTWQIQRCKKKILDLENTVAELKAQLQTLTAG